MDFEFIKPNKRKILIFLIIFIITPFPIFMYVDEGGTGWHFITFSGPIMFLVGILSIFDFESILYSKLELISSILKNIVLFPLVSYLLSCLSIWIYDKVNKK